jgi:ferric iron reductase protein FhuF
MTVPIEMPLFVGLKLKPQYLVNPWNRRHNMPTLARKFAHAFGVFVMLASLCSGCAVQPRPDRVPMSAEDLNWFQVDCGRKAEQVAMLQSMRQTTDELIASKLRLMSQPWTAVSGVNYDYVSGNPNNYINFHLNRLKLCPP